MSDSDRVLQHIRAHGRVSRLDLLDVMQGSNNRLAIALNTLLALNQITEHVMPRSAYEYTIAEPKPKPTNATRKTTHR